MSDTTYTLVAVNIHTGTVALIGSFANEDDAEAYQGVFDEIDTLHEDSEILPVTHYSSMPDTIIMFKIAAVGETIILDQVLEPEGTDEMVVSRTVKTEHGPVQSIHGLVYDRDRAEELVEELAAQIESHGLEPEIIRNSSEMI